MSDTTQTSTSTLRKRMKAASSAQSFVRNNEHNFEDDDLVGYLTALHAALMARDNKKRREQVFRDVDLDSGFGHQIFKGRKTPERENALKLAVGLQADEPQAQKILRLAGRRALCIRVRRDAVLMMAFQRHDSYSEIQQTLFELGLPPLGEGPN